MTQSVDERRQLIETACKQLFVDLEDSVEQFKHYENAQVSDDYDSIHRRLLFMTAVERDLSYLYRQATALRHQVEVSRDRAKDLLEDAKMEAVQKPTFKNPTTYSSRPETEGKLRSLTFEEHYDVAIWEKLYKQTQYLVDVVRSYQQDANKERRDIDTRLKILSLKF